MSILQAAPLGSRPPAQFFRPFCSSWTWGDRDCSSTCCAFLNTNRRCRLARGFLYFLAHAPFLGQLRWNFIHIKFSAARSINLSGLPPICSSSVRQFSECCSPLILAC